MTTRPDRRTGECCAWADGICGGDGTDESDDRSADGSVLGLGPNSIRSLGDDDRAAVAPRRPPRLPRFGPPTADEISAADSFGRRESRAVDVPGSDEAEIRRVDLEEIGRSLSNESDASVATSFGRTSPLDVDDYDRDNLPTEWEDPPAKTSAGSKAVEPFPEFGFRNDDGAPTFCDVDKDGNETAKISEPGSEGVVSSARELGSKILKNRKMVCFSVIVAGLAAIGISSGIGVGVTQLNDSSSSERQQYLGDSLSPSESEVKVQPEPNAQDPKRPAALDEWCGCSLNCKKDHGRKLLSQDQGSVDIFTRHLTKSDCDTPGTCPDQARFCTCFYDPDGCTPLAMGDPLAFGTCLESCLNTEEHRPKDGWGAPKDHHYDEDDDDDDCDELYQGGHWRRRRLRSNDKEEEALVLTRRRRLTKEMDQESEAEDVDQELEAEEQVNYKNARVVNSVLSKDSIASIAKQVSANRLLRGSGAGNRHYGEANVHADDLRRMLLSIGDMRTVHEQQHRLRSTLLTGDTDPHKDAKVGAGDFEEDEDVFFVFLDGNPGAFFRIGEDRIPARAGTLVSFKGNAMVHNTVVPGGMEVRLLGPIATRNLEGVFAAVCTNSCRVEFNLDAACCDDSLNPLPVCSQMLRNGTCCTSPGMGDCGLVGTDNCDGGTAMLATLCPGKSDSPTMSPTNQPTEPPTPNPKNRPTEPPTSSGQGWAPAPDKLGEGSWKPIRTSKPSKVWKMTKCTKDTKESWASTASHETWASSKTSKTSKKSKSGKWMNANWDAWNAKTTSTTPATATTMTTVTTTTTLYDDTQGCPCNTASSQFRDFVTGARLYNSSSDSCLRATPSNPPDPPVLAIYFDADSLFDYEEGKVPGGTGNGTGIGAGLHHADVGPFFSCRSGGPFAEVDINYYRNDLTESQADACYRLLVDALSTNGINITTCDDDIIGVRTSVPYVRIFRKLYSGRDLELFDLMEGEERRHFLSTYENKKFSTSTLGLCDYAESKVYGKTVTHDECFKEVNEAQATAEERDLQDYEPWIVPSSEKAVLLAPNPGIWSIDNFLSEEEMDRLEGLVHKYGNEFGQFGPCKHDKRHPANAHPLEGKVCFKMSVEHVCDGPYDISSCDLPPDLEDSEFIEGILARFQSLWPTQPDAAPYAKFQVASGGTPPVDLHADTEKIVSFVLYFSDGGASMIFPAADVYVTPKRGTAHTWLNTFEDQKTRNPASDHAVQAHPASAGERLVMLFEIPTPAFRTESSNNV